MKISDRAVLAQLANDHGIHFMHEVRDSSRFAQDAQATLSTTGSAGVLNIFTTYVDPKTIDILFAPLRATEIFGEEKLGDWTTLAAEFPIAEQTGTTTAYGDFNDNGNSSANFNYESRQQFYFQTMLELGEREVAMASKGRLDLVSQVQGAAINTINRYQNKTYFYGVSGLKNYGLLNDPLLYDAIVPNTVDGETTWANKDSVAIFNDIAKLVRQVVSQSDGLVDVSSRFTLAMSPTIEAVLSSTINTYGVNALTEIQDRYKNLRVVSAPEYTTDAGELIQLIADNIMGQDTGTCAFSEKLRNHAVVIGTSSYKQKKSAGTWGAIIKQPSAIAQMLGV